jgi:hypothetical protein
LKAYLHFHKHEFESFRIVEPFLEAWHTEWTFLCDINETFWAPDGSEDPSTLGYSSCKIGQDPPTNLKKVDYYPNCELVYLILDARIIDCWRYGVFDDATNISHPRIQRLAFKTTDIIQYSEDLKETDKLPSFEELETMAAKLCQAYSSVKGHHEPLIGLEDDYSWWLSIVPRGSVWVALHRRNQTIMLCTRSDRERRKCQQRGMKPAPPRRKGLQRKRKTHHSKVTACQRLQLPSCMLPYYHKRQQRHWQMATSATSMRCIRYYQ